MAGLWAAVLFGCASTETEGDVAFDREVAETEGAEAEIGCTTDHECDDGIACTIDHCRDGECFHDPCTDCCEDGWSCLPHYGCGPAPRPCTEDEECADDIRCTLDRCLDQTHCQNLPQNDLCEDDEICLAALGCIPRPPDSCEVDEDCFGDMPCLGLWECAFEFGCQFMSPLDCDDHDACTEDDCIDAEGGCVHGILDADDDGYGDEDCGGDDCNDGDESVNPGADEACNSVDDDCDGETDEGCCEEGGPCTTSCGSTGTRECNPDGSEGDCVPPVETCNDMDDDCDGSVDEGFECLPEETGTCTTGCGSTGTHTCTAACEWGECVPPSETCNGDDDDCDGSADEDFTCVAGSTGSCTTGCGSTGTRTCTAACEWGDCTPPSEACNGEDDDCDGSVDEGFVCIAGSTGSCTTGCGSTGTRECLANCTWDSCVPPAETCNGVDDNCNGACDETFTCCARQPMDCTLLGWVGGTAVCLNNCMAWDTSGCTNCGNGTIDSGEQCDGSNLGGNNCTTIGMGFAGGTLACDDCAFDVTQCHFCGNGAVDVGEQCDGDDLDGNDCTTVPGGFTGGDLNCTTACTFDTSECESFDPSGIYTITPPPNYTCASGLVNFNITTMTFSDSGSALVVTGAPCPMTGLSARTGTINVTCTLFGTCNETYSLTGTFTGDNTWTGTFTATFTGGVWCLDCTNQSFPVSGSR
jgi:hypothetical protein